jgi:hypothetical protein
VVCRMGTIHWEEGRRGRLRRPRLMIQWQGDQRTFGSLPSHLLLLPGNDLNFPSSDRTLSSDRLPGTLLRDTFSLAGGGGRPRATLVALVGHSATVLVLEVREGTLPSAKIYRRPTLLLPPTLPLSKPLSTDQHLSPTFAIVPATLTRPRARSPKPSNPVPTLRPFRAVATRDRAVMSPSSTRSRLATVFLRQTIGPPTLPIRALLPHPSSLLPLLTALPLQ